jgi:TRAP-type C4-dicarboxylate transport system permease small subunit
VADVETAVERAVEGVTRALHALGALAIALLIVVILYDAAGRLLFNRPFPGTTELAANAMVLIRCPTPCCTASSCV